MDVHLAQINIGTMRARTDDPLVAEFMANLDRINAQADAAPGFVWRLQTDDGNATDIQIFPNPLQLVNMSVWESAEALKAYVYRTDHVEFFRRRAEWFEADGKRVALWHVPAGSVPELDDAVRRVEFLERHGPSPYAFGFGRTPEMLTFEVTDSADPTTLDLVSRLMLKSRSRVVPDAEWGDLVIRARVNGKLVGCGAIRRSEMTVGEVNFVLIDDDVADLRVDAALLDQLELEAGSLGLVELVWSNRARRPTSSGRWTD